MNPIETLQALNAVSPTPIAPMSTQASAPPDLAGARFGDLVSEGVQAVDDQVAHADAMVRAFAVDASVPIHQVTIALEQARIAVELALQVRSRIVEGYRDIMNTQL